MSSVSNCVEILSNTTSFTENVFAVQSEVISQPLLSSVLKYTAICNGSTLTILLNVENKGMTTIAEMDFENTILAITWDKTAGCIVVGDSAGALHLITSDGSLLFSKKLPIPGSAKFVCLQFLDNKSTDGIQTLIAILDNGGILGISNLPVTTICSLAATQPSALAIVFTSLQFLKCLLPIKGLSVVKACCYLDYTSTVESDAEHSPPAVCNLNIVLIDSSAGLNVACLGCLSAPKSPSIFVTDVSNAQNAIPTRGCVDFHLLSMGGDEKTTCLTLYADSSLRVVDLSTLSVLTTIKLDLASPSFALVQQQRDSHSSLVLLCENNASNITISSKGKQATCKTQLLSVNILPSTAANESDSDNSEASPLSVAILDLGTRALKTSSGDAARGLCVVPSSAKSGSSSHYALVTDNEQVLHLVALPKVALDFHHSLSLALRPTSLQVLHDAATPSVVASLIADILTDSAQSDRKHDFYLSQLKGLFTCGDVAAVAHVLLTLRDPVVGFVDRLLRQAEELVEAHKSSRHSDPLKQRCISHLLRLMHVRETAGELVATQQESEVRSGGVEEEKEEVQPQSHEHEEGLRGVMATLLPQTISHTLSSYLSQGDIQQAVLITQRHMRGSVLTVTVVGNNGDKTTECNAVDLLEMIPVDIAVEQVTLFVRSVLLPAVQLLPPVVSNNTLLCIARSLCERARRIEECETRPQEALLLVTLAVEITTPLPLLATTTAEVESMQTLHRSLRLQQIIHREWGDRVSLGDISTLGAESLLFHRLDTVTEESLRCEVDTHFAAILSELGGGAGVDGVLRRWIEVTVSSRIICSGETTTEDELISDEERHFRDSTRTAVTQYKAGETCTVSRLVAVLGLISDRNAVAKLALVLFQLPSVEAAGTSRSSLTTSTLCTIASAVCDYVDTATRDALVAAMRLLKVKALAARYGITQFDPRDSKQIRAAVNIISVSFYSPTCVEDALSFAVDWGYSTVELTSLVTRALIKRVVADVDNARGTSDATAEGDLHAQHEQAVRTILTAACNTASARNNNASESLQVVVEDCLTYFIETLAEISSTIVYEPVDVERKVTARGGQSEQVKADKLRAEQIARGAINICAYFLDSLREKTIDVDVISSPAAPHKTSATASSTTTSTHKFKPSDEVNTSWCTSSLHSSLKRLLSLQCSYDIYLSLENLDDIKVCKGVVCKLVGVRAKELLALSDARDELIRNSDGVEKPPALALPLNAHCRRVCFLLGVSPVYFSHTAMKLFVEANNMPLAMDVARSLSLEKSQASNPSSSSSSDPSQASAALSPLLTSEAGDAFDSKEDSALLLDAAMTLCGIAAKKASTSSSSSHDDYSPFPIMSAKSASSAHTSQTEIPEHLAFPVQAFELSRDVLRSSIPHCQPGFIGRTLDLLCGSELVLSVYERIEGASSGANVTTLNTASAGTDSSSSSSLPSSLQLSEGVFSRDGILMQPTVVVKPLMKYALMEVRRRSVHSTGSSSTATKDAQAHDSGVMAGDVRELIEVLQKSENHLLAVRVMYASWSASAKKAELLRTSLLQLSRKILVYRDIDTSFAVACLAALQYDSMVRELKAAVPSIQSDFSRLRVVALVGEELAHLWDQEALLVVFQGLQTNARWWHVLTSFGIKLDLKSFQSSDATLREASIKGLIPQLLERNGMDLEMGIEYCQQFDLEPACALLAYIEMLLKAAPRSPGDVSWANKMRRAAARVEEQQVLTCLREMLAHVNPLDFEKIRYVCTWLVDILSLEESATHRGGGGGGSSLNDSDGDITNQSMDSTRQRIRFVNLSNLAEEIDTYRRYIDIAAYLGGIHFPAESTAQIANAGEVYIGVPVFYHERVPLWPLLDDPWSVIEPLLSSVPEIAMKLSPLCQPLQLDKNEFNSRRIKALYVNMTTPVGAAKGDTSVVADSSPFTRETKRLSLQVASESIASTVSDPLQQVDIWRWLYTRERGSDDSVAQTALESAIAITSALNGRGGADHIHAGLISDLLTLKCECTVKSFNTHLADTPYVGAMLLRHVSEPLVLLKALLDLSIEVAWDIQLRGVQALGGIITCIDLTSRAPSHAVSSFLSVLTTTIDDLARQCGLDTSPGSTEADNSPSTPSPLESLRHNLIGRMLADLDSTGTDKDASAASVASMANGFWGGGFASQSVLTPSEAEARRREDVFLSFAIATTVSTCSSQSMRRIYISQLDSVMRGKSARTTRRLTGRSRFRAAQAMHFMRCEVSDGLASDDLAHFQRFLYCLSEMQEIRLPCSEDSLLSAMGLRVKDFTLSSTSEDEESSPADPRSLIRTWVHDEGIHSEVVELARDLQLLANSEDESSWYYLLSHMVGKEQHRALLQTVAMVSAAPVFRDLCFGLMGSDVLQVVGKVLAEAAQKCHQVVELTSTRKESRPEDSDWLFCALDAAKPAEPKQSSASLNATTNDTKKPSTASHAATQGVTKLQRVMLSKRLAYRSGAWEEAPEDVLSTLSLVAKLSVTVASVMSSRLLANHASLVVVRETVISLLKTAASAGVSVESTKVRDVRSRVHEAIVANALLLLSPVFLSSVSEEAASSYILTALEASVPTISITDDSTIPDVWRVVSSATRSFPHKALFSALDPFLSSSVNSQTAVLMRSCLSSWRSVEEQHVVVIFLAWCFLRLSHSPSIKNRILSGIQSLSPTHKLDLLRIIRTGAGRIEAVMGARLPPLETLSGAVEFY